MTLRAIRFFLAVLFLELPAVADTVRLADLDVRLVQSEGKPAQANATVDRRPLTVGGQVFEHGVGVHSTSTILIHLNGTASRLSASVGVDDEPATSPGTVEFVAMGDGKQLWTSGIMKQGQPPCKLSINLTGIQQLELWVTDGGDGASGDHADWAEAVIEYSGTAPRLAYIHPPTSRMTWWREAKFGMFIHWGVYSVPAGTYKGQQIPWIGEWIMRSAKISLTEYRGFAKEFNPVKYEPDAWVTMAKKAGMKYLVITSKHHDGFALFDSNVTDWDVVDATPYGKDLLKPLADACREQKLPLGFYYSQAQDWTHPGGANADWDPAQAGDMAHYIRDIAVPQVKEILSHYGDIEVLWWDTPMNMTPELAQPLHDLLSLQPKIITNNRLGGGFQGDTETPEQEIPSTGFVNRDWETCMTMNDTWGFKSFDNNWKSTETLIRNLIDIVSKGGNYLLNVGPTALGEFPPEIIERLEQIGTWMDINSEAIYGTRASPFANLPWGRCTMKMGDYDATLYLHIFDWPMDGRLILAGLKSEITSATLLATGETLTTEAAEGGIAIHLPKDTPDPIAAVVELRLNGGVRLK